MIKPWSISTTVRNPERLRSFLKVLKKLEGKNFDKNTQEEFQILLIKERLYLPTLIPSRYKSIFSDINKEISFKIAKEVFEHQNYKDPPMRGRQSANPLNKLGFCIARENFGPIKITTLGNLFILEEYDISKVFLKSLLKLQFPNPWSEKFGESEGFKIRPFIAVLHLLKKVEGLTQREFCLFVPTFINYRDIEEYAKNILKFRKIKTKEEKEKFIEDFLKKFYKTKNLTPTQKNNLFDYGDNIMRYFRLTKYFRVEKGTFRSWKINLEPSREKEIGQLLTLYDGSVEPFDDVSKYLDYLSDISLPKLPWEQDKTKTKEIVESLVKLLEKDYSSLIEKLKAKLKAEYEEVLSENIDDLKINQLENLIDRIRILRVEIKQIKEGASLRKNINELKEIVSKLKDKEKFKQLDPIDFEYIIFQTLRILNDELDLRTNAILDDEGEPISFAPGNKPDIEGEYKSFNAIFEVTLDISRNQVYRESMPVMRHLRDFEKKETTKASYCIFISPKIHEDTNNYFWYSVRHGYEGQKQKIISFELESYVNILEFFISTFEKDVSFDHNKFKLLFEKILLDAEKKDSSVEWLNNTNSNIEKWKKEILD